MLLSSAGLKLFFAFRYPGFLTGDDLETIETAGKYALGLRYQPWEIRSLFHPLTFVWPALEAAAVAGVRDPKMLAWAAAVPAVLFSTAAAALVHALARRCGGSRTVANAAAALYAFHFLPLAFGSTSFPRPISTCLLTLAFVLVASDRPAPGGALAAGALAGAAFAVRWSEGVLLLPLVGWAAWRRRDRRVAALLIAGFSAAVLVLVGALDLWTWGRPFASLWAFFRTMYLEIPEARLLQEKPFWWYGWSVFHWAGPIAVLLVAYAWRDRRARAPLAIFGSTAVLMSLFAHEEWRYLQAAIPFLCVAAAFGWERLRDRAGPAVAAAVLALASAWGVERAASLLSHKSQPAIAAARWIRALRPQPRVLALEQAWAYGNRLYLGNAVEIRDIEWQRPLTRLSIRERATGADLVGIYADHAGPAAGAELAAEGFREAARFRKDAGRECVLYRRDGTSR